MSTRELLPETPNGDGRMHLGDGVLSLDLDSAFRELASPLKFFLRRHVTDPALVDDVVQETFYRAQRARHSFLCGRPAWPWLSAIALRLCRDLYRRSTTASATVLDLRDEDHPVSDTDPEHTYLAKEQASEVWQALSYVTERERRLLLLRDMQGVSCKEIAAAEGVSQDAIRSALRRARNNFRQAYLSVASRECEVGLRASASSSAWDTAGRFGEGLRGEHQPVAGSLS